VFGVLGDALGGRVMLCAMRSVYAVLAALLMVLALAGVLTPMWVFVIAGLVGIVRPNDQVLRNSLIGETIPPDDLIGALGLSRASVDSARVAGALTAAGLSTILGVGFVYVRGASVRRASPPPTLAGRAAGLDDHGDDGGAAPPGALDAREHRHLVRAAVRLRPRAGHDGGGAHAPAGRPRPEHGDDLDDGHAARGGGRPVPRARDGRAHARRLRHDRGADRLRRPDRARRLFAHHQRLLHGPPGLHAHHWPQVARQ